MKTLSNRLMTLAALALALSPSLALAQGTPTSGSHSHNTSLHDRSPRAHDHTPVARH